MALFQGIYNWQSNTNLSVTNGYQAIHITGIKNNVTLTLPGVTVSSSKIGVGWKVTLIDTGNFIEEGGQGITVTLNATDISNGHLINGNSSIVLSPDSASNAFIMEYQGGKRWTLLSGSAAGGGGGGDAVIIEQFNVAGSSVRCASQNNASRVFTTISGGRGNAITGTDQCESDYATISGGQSNAVYQGGKFSVIGGGSLNAISANSSTTASNFSFIGGGVRNSIANAGCSVISGGCCNSIFSNFSVAVGGCRNIIFSESGVISGGLVNRICIDSPYSTISGGYCNTILKSASLNLSEYSTIGGGNRNKIEGGEVGTISGGYCNLICFNQEDPNYDTAPTIGGGKRNTLFSASNSAIFAGNCNQVVNSRNSIVVYGDRVRICNNSSGISCYNSVLGGGLNTILNSNFNTLGGGFCNTISNVTGNGYGVLSGGLSNVITSSSNSVISGGFRNSVQGTSSSVLGGSLNTVNGDLSFVGGGTSNKVCDDYSSIAGGSCNSVLTGACFSIIAGGFCNSTQGDLYQSVVNGCSNRVIFAPYSVISGGRSNLISCNVAGSNSQHSSIVSGCANQVVNSSFSSISSGCSNVIFSNSSLATISGGRNNTISDSCGSIALSGNNNFMCNADASSVLGGVFNTVCTSCASYIGGGVNNTISDGCNSSIGSGCLNTITTSVSNSSILGGIRNSICNSDCAVISGGNFNYVLSSNLSSVSGNMSGSSGGSLNFVFGGVNLVQNSVASSILGGCVNLIRKSISGGDSWYNLIGNGRDNQIVSTSICASLFANTVVGGLCNTIIQDSYNTSPFPYPMNGIFIGGGSDNGICTCSGYGSSYSSILGGFSNSIVASKCSTISGGLCNTICSLDAKLGTDGSFIGGGNRNSIIDNISTSSLSFTPNVIVGGHLNKVVSETGNSNFIGGGSSNETYASYSAIVAGSYNRIKSWDGSTYMDSSHQFIGGGSFNSTDGWNNVIVGGYANYNYGLCSTIGGGNNNAIGKDYCNATISGGSINSVTSDFSFIGGGLDNCADGDYSSISGGRYNTSISTNGFIGSGSCNTICGENSAIGGGFRNLVKDCNGSILGGCFNTAEGAGSVVVGGTANRAVCLSVAFPTTHAFIGGGRRNTICGSNDAVLVGGSNNIIREKSDFSFLGGGQNNSTCNSFSMVIGGGCNKATNLGSIVIGGTSNNALSPRSFIGGGYGNNIAANSCESVILTGRMNTMYPFSNCSLILSGERNCISDIPYNMILGGTGNCISEVSRLSSSNIIGIGFSNSICGGGHTFVGNGCRNTVNNVASSTAFLGTGCFNTIAGGSLVNGCNNVLNSSFVGFGVGNNLSGNSFIGYGIGNTGNNGYGGNVYYSTLCVAGGNGFVSAIVAGMNNVVGSYSIPGGATGPTTDPTVTPWSSAFIGNGYCNSAIGFIGSGIKNTAYGYSSSILNGVSNTISRSGWVPGSAQPATCYNTILGGTGNATGLVNLSNHNLIGGGVLNRTSGSGTSILNGCFNTISDSSTNSTILGGTGGFIGYDVANSQKVTNGNIIGVGSLNSILGGQSSNILNGTSNTITSGATGSYNYYSTILSGTANIITRDSSSVVILTGSSHFVCQSTSSIIGVGSSNSIVNSQNASIIGGTQNIIQGVSARTCHNVILAGCSNLISDANCGTIINGCCSSIETLSHANMYSVVGGLYAQSTRYGQRSYSSAPLTYDKGSFQTIDLSLSRTANNNGLGYFYLDGVLGTIFNIPIEQDVALAFTLNVSAYNLSAKRIGHAMYKVIIYREGALSPTLPTIVNGYVSKIGSPNNIGYQGDLGSFDIGTFYFSSGSSSSFSLNANTTYSGVTRWVAHISGMEYSIA